MLNKIILGLKEHVTMFVQVRPFNGAISYAFYLSNRIISSPTVFLVNNDKQVLKMWISTFNTVTKTQNESSDITKLNFFFVLPKAVFVVGAKTDHLKPCIPSEIYGKLTIPIIRDF